MTQVLRDLIKGSWWCWRRRLRLSTRAERSAWAVRVGWDLLAMAVAIA